MNYHCVCGEYSWIWCILFFCAVWFLISKTFCWSLNNRLSSYPLANHLNARNWPHSQRSWILLQSDCLVKLCLYIPASRFVREFVLEQTVMYKQNREPSGTKRKQLKRQLAQRVFINLAKSGTLQCFLSWFYLKLLRATRLPTSHFHFGCYWHRSG